MTSGIWGSSTVYVGGLCIAEDKPSMYGSASMMPSLVTSSTLGYESGDGDDEEAEDADSA